MRTKLIKKEKTKKTVINHVENYTGKIFFRCKKNNLFMLSCPATFFPDALWKEHTTLNLCTKKTVELERVKSKDFILKKNGKTINLKHLKMCRWQELKAIFN